MADTTWKNKRPHFLFKFIVGNRSQSFSVVTILIKSSLVLYIWVLLKAGPRPATAQRPTAHGPRRPSSPRSAACGLRWPGGPEAQSWFSRVFCPEVNPRSCTDLHRVWACKMEVRSSCMTPWNVLSVEHLSLALIFCPRHRSPVPGTDLPSQALIFCSLHWSSVPCPDLLSLALISVCPLHWSSVPSTDLLSRALMNS